jgi:hypothetical protein
LTYSSERSANLSELSVEQHILMDQVIRPGKSNFSPNTIVLDCHPTRSKTQAGYGSGGRLKAHECLDRAKDEIHDLKIPSLVGRCL